MHQFSRGAIHKMEVDLITKI